MEAREWLVTDKEGLGIVIYDIGAADAAIELAWNFYGHEGFDPVAAVPFVDQKYPPWKNNDSCCVSPEGDSHS